MFFLVTLPLRMHINWEVGLFSQKFDDAIVTNLAAHQAEVLAYVESLMPGAPAVADVVQRANIVGGLSKIDPRPERFLVNLPSTLNNRKTKIQ